MHNQSREKWTHWGSLFITCPEAKETINLIHSMFFHMSIFKLVHISILMYPTQRESLPKTALYKLQRNPTRPTLHSTLHHPRPVVTLSSRTTFNQSSLKNDPSKIEKQNNKRRNYDMVLLICRVVSISVKGRCRPHGTMAPLELDCKQLNGKS